MRFWNGSLEGNGFTRDVSAAGLYLESPALVEVGTRLHLEIDLFGEPFFAEGVVARRVRVPRQVQAMRKQGFGVRLLTLSEALHELQRSEAAAGPQVRLSLDLRDPPTLARTLERDVRVGVIFVPTEEDHAVGSRVGVRLMLPPDAEDDEPRLDISGTLIARVEEPRGFGVQIADLDAVRARLVEALETATKPS